MKIIEVLCENGNAVTLYHVTLTKNIPGIKKKGIVLLRPTNWVKAGSKERYGDGSIFSFEKINDAIKWAAKWDWDLNKQIGTGKVSIIVFTSDSSKWTIDLADPISQAGEEGSWLKSFNAVPPKNIKEVIPVTSDLVKQMMRTKNA